MKACVTGGAGFIGSHIVDRLLRDGHEVVVLDDLSTGRKENLAHAMDAVRLLVADIRDEGAVADALRGCEVVFHQAALAAVARSVADPALVNDVNIGGTLRILIGARDAGVRRVVFASSSSVYGDTPTLPKVESMPISPRSPYAATKAAGESYLQAFWGSYGLETVALRYFNIYGPRQSPKSQYAAVIPLFIQATRAGEAPTIHGDGLQTRDFSFVHDTVDAVVKAADAKDAPGQVMNVGGGGRRISVLDLAHAIGDAVGWKGEPRHVDARVGDVRDSLADTTRAQEVLGWRPRTTLEEGIRQTVEAYLG